MEKVKIDHDTQYLYVYPLGSDYERREIYRDHIKVILDHKWDQDYRRWVMPFKKDIYHEMLAAFGMKPPALEATPIPKSARPKKTKIKSSLNAASKSATRSTSPVSHIKSGTTDSSEIRAVLYGADNNEPNGALLCLDGNIKDCFINRFKENFNHSGAHITSGGKISVDPIKALIATSGGALGASYFASGSLFIATANPATLMAAANGGVYSAVMGTGGIVGQAAFMPVAGALMPVLAPLIAFQLISTIMTLSQFKDVQKRFDYIEKNINRFLQRQEAVFIAEIQSSAKRISQIEEEFSICHCFTPDMMIRLAQLEDKINPIFERYNFLYQAQEIQSQATIEDLKFKQNDAYFAIISSILDLRLDALRIKLKLQDNPAFIPRSVEQLTKKTDYYKCLWSGIAKNHTLIKEVASDLKEAVDEMSWWNKNMPKFLFGNKEEKIEKERKAASFNSHAEALRRDFQREITEAQALGGNLKQNLATFKSMNLVYWRDEDGEHSYYTDELELLPDKLTSR